jgi:hypothetical protein
MSTMSSICVRKKCTRQAADGPYCLDCVRHIRVLHYSACVGDDLYWRGNVLICNGCNASSCPQRICRCVTKDDPDTNLRPPLGTSSDMVHYFPDDFPECEPGVCPRSYKYHNCAAAYPVKDCYKICKVAGWQICDRCTRDHKNHCPACNRGWLLNADMNPNAVANVCSRHIVHKCTCGKIIVNDPNSLERVQCVDCDMRTNTIICCGRVHKPHSLTYPARDVRLGHCMWHSFSLWPLVQDEPIWQLYKTVAASPERKRMSFYLALMLRLTWQEGDHSHMSTTSIHEYILSQHRCAASAIVRIRWLPQPLRLMILGYI